MFRRVSHLALIVLLLLTSAPAHATDPESMIARAEAFYEKLEYEQALKILIDVIQHKDADETQQARAYLYMGVCFTALGSEENAVRAFIEVLRLRPNFRMPDGVSPSIQAHFQTALRAAGIAAAPGPGALPGATSALVTTRAPEQATAGVSFDIDIHIDDPYNEVTALIVRWRRADAKTDYDSLTLERAPAVTEMVATISGSTTGDDKGTLHYYVQAVDVEGRVLGNAGSETNPREIALLEGEGARDRRVWWTLGIIGGVSVVAAIVATSLSLSLGERRPPHSADVVVTIR